MVEMVDNVTHQMEALTRRIESRLRALGWSQNELERRLTELRGVSHRGVLSQFKRRKRLPSSALAMAIAEALGVDVRWLLHGIGGPTADTTTDAGPLLAELDRVATAWPDHVREAVRALALGRPSAYTVEDLEQKARLLLATEPREPTR